MEKLQGADVVTFLASRHEYTEQMVATIVTQVNYSCINNISLVLRQNHRCRNKSNFTYVQGYIYFCVVSKGKTINEPQKVICKANTL